MTYRVTVQIHFCYGHRLLDYEGACAHPHGHNGHATHGDLAPPAIRGQMP